MMLGIAVTVAVVLTLGAIIYAFTRPGRREPEKHTHSRRLEAVVLWKEREARQQVFSQRRTESSATVDDTPVRPADPGPDPATLMIAAAVLSEPSSTPSYESPSYDHSSSHSDHSSSSYDGGSSDSGSSGSWD